MNWKVTMRSGNFFPGEFDTALAAEAEADGWSARHPVSSDYRIGGAEYFDDKGNKVTLVEALATAETAYNAYLAAMDATEEASPADADTYRAFEDVAYAERERTRAIAAAIEEQELRANKK